MWIIGLLVGAVFGGAIFGLEGALLGALAGAALGLGLRQLMRSHDAKVGESTLEARLAAIEHGLKALQSRIAALEAGAPMSRAETMPPTAAELTDAGADAPAESSAFPVASVISDMPAPVAEAPEPIASREALEVSAPTLAKPRRPSLFAPIVRWFTGGNTLVRVGVVILFFGVAFLLKHAYERVHVPIELRLTGVALTALVLLFVGWRLRAKRPGYALALQGGAVGLLYLTVFAAFRLYQLLPPEAAFALLLCIAVLSAALAVLQDAMSLAVLGASGGFLAPILASTGSGSHVMLFGYYVVLNLGIVGIAWYKAWRPLNVLGFVFTFGIGTLWGNRYYRPELFASVEPFLIIFFLLYLAIPVLFARRRAPQLKDYVDGTLVFGTPLVAFGLQTQLVRGIEYGAAWSALTLAFIYLLLARALWSRRRDELRMLVEAFLALGGVFGTLTIPLALEGRWVSAAWALEGAGILWTGVRQNRALARAFGLFLQAAAGAAFLGTFTDVHGAVPVFNSACLGAVFISVAALFSNWYLERHRGQLRAWEPPLAKVVFVWGLLWWIGGGAREIDIQLGERYEDHGFLLFATASCVAFSLLWKAIDWRLARYPAIGLLPAMVLLAALCAADHRHPLESLGLVAWPAAFAAQLWLLRRHEENDHRYFDFLHAGQLWLFAALAAWELGWATDWVIGGGAVWKVIAWGIVPALLLALLARRSSSLPWPVRGHTQTYMLLGAAPLAIFLTAWILLANIHGDGDPHPLPYVPLLNPLDLAQFGALLAIIVWINGLKRTGLADYARDYPWPTFGVLGTLAFVGLNGTLLRTLHHWAGVAFYPAAWLDSMLVQAALSIFWTVLALCIMLLATRRGARALWLVGAALMAVVVVKLFVVDLSHIGGVERIVSFIVVGLLMLLIGYFSPVPPKKAAEAAP